MTKVMTGEVVLDRLNKRYQHVVAIRDVSLHARPGQFVTLLGPSGSGKTTTLMAIAGFIKTDSGSILMDGKDLTQLPPNRRDLGMVFQHYALFPTMTVAENVAFPLSVRGRPQAEITSRVAHALQMVKLESFGDRYPNQLSGGQQQRVALARAIVFAPSVLLMDEPLGALDKNLRDHMQSEIRRIHRELGTTVFYVTHDQDEALSMSDIVVVMRDGGVEQIGSPEDLYARPQNAFVATFIGGANVLRGTVIARDGAQATIRHSSGQDFRAPVDRAVGEAAAIAIRPERIRPGAPTSAGQTGIAGALVEVTYLGAITRATVDVGGTEITASLPDAAGLQDRTAGARVELHWESASAVWLTEEQGENQNA